MDLQQFVANRLQFLLVCNYLEFEFCTVICVICFRDFMNDGGHILLVVYWCWAVLF